MLKALKALFEDASQSNPGDTVDSVNLAAAALLMETARADFQADEQEMAAMQTRLIETLGVKPDTIRDLMHDAKERVDNSTSLYEFTHLINEHYAPAQKVQLIEAMWAVAYADGRIDKYEEHLIRKVAELIYVSHADYIRCKLQAESL